MDGESPLPWGRPGLAKQPISDGSANTMVPEVWTSPMNPAPMQPGGTIVGRIIAALIMVVFGVALLAVLVPVGVFVLALAAILIVAAMVRGWFKRASAPNGVFDGRRNVRVVERNDDVLEP